MEETITKERKKAFQLKRLLNQGKEELGDLRKWKNLDPGQMIFLKMLNSEVTPQSLDRINSLDKNEKEEGMYSILVANYFALKAKAKGREDIAEKIHSIIAKKEVKPEDIGLYAINMLQGSLNYGQLENSLLRCYMAEREQKVKEMEPDEKYPKDINLEESIQKRVYFKDNRQLGEIHNLLLDPATMHAEWLIWGWKYLLPRSYALPLNGIEKPHSIDSYVVKASPKKPSFPIKLHRILKLFGKEHMPVKCELEETTGTIKTLVYKYDYWPLESYYLSTSPRNIDFKKWNIIDLDEIKIEKIKK
ncbi:MAG: hypothetical protein ABIB71_07910 [Candidatus Woesearchaeota archaeon]